MLEVDRAYDGRLHGEEPPYQERGPAAVHILELPEPPGRIRVQCRSLEFNASLIVFDEIAGRVLAEDKDGGLGLDALVTFDPGEAQGVSIFVIAQEPGTGFYRLTVSAAEPRGQPRADQLRQQHEEWQDCLRTWPDERDPAILIEAWQELALGFQRSGLHLERLRCHQELLPLYAAQQDSYQVAYVHGSIGDSYKHLGEIAAAREAYARGRAAAKEVGDEALITTYEGDEGYLLVLEGKIAEALEVHLRVAQSFLRLQRQSWANAAFSNAADCAHRLGKGDLARELVQKAIDVAPAQGAEKDVLSNRLDLVDFTLDEGEFDLALRTLQNLLAEAVANDWLDLQARAKYQTGLARISLGELEIAEEELRSAHAIATTIRSKTYQFESLSALGDLALLRFESRTAEELYTQCVELALGFGGDVLHGRALRSLSRARFHAGDLDGAREFLLRAEKLLRGNPYQWAIAILRGTGLGRSSANCFADQQVEDALAILLEADRSTLTVQALQAYGNFWISKGREDAGREKLEAALALARGLDLTEAEGSLLAELAYLLCASDPAAAEAYLAGAFSLLDKTGPFFALTAHEAAAQLALRKQAIPQALDHLDQGWAVFENHRSTASGETSPWILRGGTLRFSELLQDVAIRALATDLANPGPSVVLEKALLRQGAWKGVQLAAGMLEHRGGLRSAEHTRLRQALQGAQANYHEQLAELSARVQAGAASEEVRERRAALVPLQEQRSEAARALMEFSPREAVLYDPGPLSVESLRALLDSPGTALVEYAHGRSELYAYVVTKEDLKLLRLAELQSTLSTIGSYLDGISEVARLAKPEDIARQGSALYQVLLAPILELCGTELRRLLVVPSASLASLPLEALVVPNSKGRTPAKFEEIEYAIDRLEFCYLPSTRVGTILASLPGRASPGRVLLFGDPRFASEQAMLPLPVEANSPQAEMLEVAAILRGTLNLKPFARLPSSRQEAIELAKLWDVTLAGRENSPDSWDARDLRLSTGKLDLRLGKYVDAEALQGDLRDYAVLHFATHALVDASHPDRTGIVLSAKEGEEQLFSRADVQALDLDADLVVLSACQTAGGHNLRGEGVESLATACIYAGARNVVASLWSLSDSAASDMMQRFYAGYLREGLSPSRALRQAKLELRASKATLALRGAGRIKQPLPESAISAAHPFFWAAFVHIGLP